MDEPIKTPLHAANDSLYQRQLVNGFRWLKFIGPVENEYREHFADTVRLQLRVFLGAGLCLGIGIGLLDYFTAPEGSGQEANLIRTFVTRPLLVAAFLATFVKPLKRHLNVLCIVVGFAIGAGSLMITFMGYQNLPGSPILVALLMTMIIYLCLGLRYFQAVATAMSLLVIYAIGVTVWPESPVANGYAAMFLIFTNVIGATAAYQLEFNRRSNFLREKALQAVALTDPLTNLGNRRAFDQYFNNAWLHCVRERLPLSLAMIDIDHFKIFNDTYGHQAGDRCLIAVANVLRRTCRRPLDFMARFGGEEFILVLPGADLDYVSNLMEETREKVQALGIPNVDSSAASTVTISTGVAYLTPYDSERSIDGAIQIADEAMYEAKAAGRNRIHLSKESDQPDFCTGSFARNKVAGGS